MPIYPDSSHLHPDQGMTLADMKAAEKVAAARNEIIMFRDTGAWSRPYIAAGHPTKPFHVKGKSSNWGPQAGLVPENSEFSKAFAATDIQKGIKANQDAINGYYAKPIPLFLSRNFIQSELEVPKGISGHKPIDRVTNPRPGVLYFFCTKPNDDPSQPGKPYVLFGKINPAGLYEIFSFPLLAAKAPPSVLPGMEAMGEPLMVMTIFGANQPLTGDYDLFAICPSWNDYGTQDKKMDPTLDDPRIKASNDRSKARVNALGPVSSSHLMAYKSLQRLHAAKTLEDPHRGNLTLRISSAIQSLVQGMGGRYPRVHHNAESGRPFAPGAEDGFPLTTFHPRRGIGGYPFLHATINDTGDLLDYFKTLYASGYYPPRNRSWNMSNLRDDNLVKARITRELQNRLNGQLPQFFR